MMRRVGRRGDLARAPPRRRSARRCRTSRRWSTCSPTRARVRGRDGRALRIARAFDSEDADEVAFRRLALAVMKYWVCKRGAPLAAEALECLGGNGYVEEAPMAQFYRDIQLGTVWEGSGNVIALDVLRALAREPQAASAFLAECELAAGADGRFDAHLASRARAAAARASPSGSGRRMERAARWSRTGARAAGEPAAPQRAALRVIGVLRWTSGAARARVRRSAERGGRRGDRRAGAGAVGAARGCSAAGPSPRLPDG